MQSGESVTASRRSALWGARAAAMRGEIGAVALMAGIAALAQRSGMFYLLFPELAALAYDILTRPYGTWARAPGHLILTPLLAATGGTLIARHLGYSVVSILASVTVSLGLIGILRSPIAPAISAGLLPVTLGLTTWRYPPALTFGTGLLAGIALIRSRSRRTAHLVSTERETESIDDLLEETPREFSWLPAYGGLITILAMAAVRSGIRFLLFPPLAVIGVEMFAHTRTCPWSQERWKLPIACTLTAAVGTFCAHVFGAGAVAVGLSTASGIAVLQAMELHLPPALAVGLLPFVMRTPSITFPAAVGAGTTALSVGFGLWRRYGTRFRV